MKYAVEMGSGAMIYIPSFMKVSSSIQKLIGNTQVYRQDGDHISPLTAYGVLTDFVSLGTQIDYTCLL
jgi:hypothetical protein